MPAAEFGETGPGLLHDREHLQGADQAIAGGGLVQAQDVARGLAPQGAAHFVEHGEHVAVADLGAAEFDAALGERMLQTRGCSSPFRPPGP